MEIEAGITNYFFKWININIAVVMDKDGNESMGTGQAFPIPDKYLKEIQENGLGILMDRIFNGVELAKSVGGVSYITHQTISRIDITKDAFIMAMTKFINDDIWSDKE
jgi:non-canonical (house-cleaning) NTP pyrophosphatase